MRSCRRLFWSMVLPMNENISGGRRGARRSVVSASAAVIVSGLLTLHVRAQPPAPPATEGTAPASAGQGQPSPATAGRGGRRAAAQSRPEAYPPPPPAEP